MREQLTLRPDRAMVGRYHADGPETERLAAARVAPRSGTQRARVLAELRKHGSWGATDYELWVSGIGARPHVPGTRREELIRDGWRIVDSGLRRRTDTGVKAIVWVLQDSESETAHSPAEADGGPSCEAPTTAATAGPVGQPPDSEIYPF